MTGFGSAAFRCGAWSFELEARSVNHRHLDARVRLPRALTSLEPVLRSRVQERFGRGKLDVVVVAPEGGTPAPQLDIDLSVARDYLAASRSLAESEGMSAELDAAGLLALPGVARLAEPELDEGDLREPLLEALDRALDGLADMRAKEGSALARDLEGRLARVIELVADLEARSGEVRAAASERLQKRARQLQAETGLLDEARLHQEIVLAAERMDIQEELVRLRSHVEQFRSLLAEADAQTPVGRRLEFLLQELGREANTIGSKGSDAPIAHRVVELKGELECMREQVLNVE